MRTTHKQTAQKVKHCKMDQHDEVIHEMNSRHKNQGEQ